MHGDNIHKDFIQPVVDGFNHNLRANDFNWDPATFTNASNYYYLPSALPMGQK